MKFIHGQVQDRKLEEDIHKIQSVKSVKTVPRGN